ncbi:hypothetical protein TNIN_13281 [Trichonephila inaurata madagascariensis]|uniref:Uncharacterized protein n=1 Tax=Trichonephila inaurata madagascariensis TaxID=2747483 RepID=A0A8X7CPV9_9ARAC|nr:hypothetical protein TNIN_13281 [Trichonephila inaurata madagascariensis]
MSRESEVEEKGPLFGGKIMEKRSFISSHHWRCVREVINNSSISMGRPVAAIVSTLCWRTLRPTKRNKSCILERRGVLLLFFSSHCKEVHFLSSYFKGTYNTAVSFSLLILPPGVFLGPGSFVSFRMLLDLCIADAAKSFISVFFLGVCPASFSPFFRPPPTSKAVVIEFVEQMGRAAAIADFSLISWMTWYLYHQLSSIGRLKGKSWSKRIMWK